MTRLLIFTTAVIGVAALAAASPAIAVQKAAVFPFDLHDAQQDGEVVPQLNPDDLKRLKLVADELKSLMEKSGNYEVVDLSPMAKEIEAASPFNKCNGCEAELAKKAGAEIAVTGYRRQGVRRPDQSAGVRPQR